MVKMTQEEAAKVIDKKTTEAMNLIREAEAIADEYGLDFNFDVAYGMGGYYHGRQASADWDSSDEENWDSSDESYGWISSSQGC